MKLSKRKITDLKQIISGLIIMLYHEGKDVKKKNQYLDMIARGGMEQAIAFQIGLYLYEQIKTKNWFDGLSIDMEYNKNGLYSKRTPRMPNGTRPDIIIHNRGKNDLNVLIVEVKGWWNKKSRRNDRIKLEDFTFEDGEFQYGLGVFLDLRKTGCEPQYYVDGQLINQ